MDEKIENLCADEIYDSTMRLITSEVDKALQAFCGLFDDKKLLQIKNLDKEIDKTVFEFVNIMIEKYNSIPKEFRRVPPANILGPCINSLKYNLEEPTISEMFTNLIKNSMDKRVVDDINPSYVQVAGLMNSLDARLFRHIYEKTLLAKRLPVFQPQLRCNKCLSYFPEALPEYFCDIDAHEDSLFEISTALTRLQKIGLIEMNFNECYNDSVYMDIIDKNNGFNDIKKIYEKAHLDITDFIIELHSKGVIILDVEIEKLAKAILT